ncbi:MAG: fumarate hydratase [Symbiobacteriaceae bacterium]|nr:fumarate hydratase [Symbiobacteriaceae bacterium]
MPRVISSAEITAVVKELFLRSCVELGDDVLAAYRQALAEEESPLGRQVLTSLLTNAQVAKEKQIACCQDTGTAIVYLQIGQEVSWQGAPLDACINEGVRQAYREGYLRMSIHDPLSGKNTGDNTPAVIHYEVVAGDQVTVQVLPKGGGSENMTRLGMLLPAVGLNGVGEFVVETVVLAGGKACPPLVVGVGLGASADAVTWLAKKALLRPLGQLHPNPKVADLEKDWLAKINDTGIGPLGMGGRITALAVHIETQGCHITGLPVAVNLQCHAHRYGKAVL